MTRQFHKSTRTGFIALITVLVVTAVALIVGTSIALKSVSYAQGTQAEISSTQALMAANACVETALGALGASTTTWPTVTASTISVGSNTCYLYAVTATSGPSGAIYQVIQATSTVSGYTRKLQVIVATNTPAISISSWNQVGDF